jgi:hypothetical protein
MSDINIRSDSVNVEQIMNQIRARIREKRGVDYTEQQIRELASARLERYLDPQKVRSGLFEQFRAGMMTARGDAAGEAAGQPGAEPSLLRRLLHPLEVLFAWPLHKLRGIRKRLVFLRYQADSTELTYELLHNLVLETTRLGIEVKNLKMRVESLSSRFDFSERRTRALEGKVVYRHEPDPEPEAATRPAQAAPGREAEGAGGDARRKRRRRRGRRGGVGRPAGDEAAGGVSAGSGEEHQGPGGEAEPPAEAAGGSPDVAPPAGPSTPPGDEHQ